MTTPAAQPPAIELARALVRELVAGGVRDVVLAPGSRSAPLAYALSDAHDAGWLRLTVRVDERGAGFVALGLARSHTPARPVAVVTTSGTAVANLHPAVLEASHAGDPLIVISADRPHELRGTGANQTTIQPGMFGAAPRWQAELPANFDVGAVRGLITRGLAAAVGKLTADPGPVHLNVAFREPLVPERTVRDMAGDLARVEQLRQPDWVVGGPPEPVQVGGSAPLPVVLPAGRRTLLVAGDRAGERWLELGEYAGWPVLAEPSSGARRPGSIRFYRDLLAVGLADDVERVVVVGHPTLSRPVSRLLARRDVEVVVVAGQRWTDVAGVVSMVAGAIEVPGAAPEDLVWLERWRSADAALAHAVAGGQLLSLAERAAGLVWEHLVPVLVLGSSNAIRVVDSHVTGREDGARVVSNRGLAGIDGTLATAWGLALGTGGPVRALVGDLTFLHDAMSLLRGEHEDDVDLQVVVLNDSGGAIFESLEPGELARQDVVARRVFERVFRAPQRVDIGALAAGLEVSHTRIDLAEEGALKQLAAALALPVRGRSVLEVRLAAADLCDSAAGRAALARRIVALPS